MCACSLFHGVTWTKTMGCDVNKSHGWNARFWLVETNFAALWLVRTNKSHYDYLQGQARNINLDSQTTVAIEDTARQKKCTVAIFYLYLTLLICYLPNTCIALMIVVDASFPYKMIHFSDALVYLNSCLDPLIYCWKMRQVRLTAMNILRNIHFRC